jgi:hypothetical protein
MTRQATKSYVQRANAFGLVVHEVPPIVLLGLRLDTSNIKITIFHPGNRSYGSPAKCAGNAARKVTKLQRPHPATISVPGAKKIFVELRPNREF